MTLQDAFSEIKDHRRGPAVRYDLQGMIVMAICAVLCGCDDWVDVADWCEEEEEEWLKTFLSLPKGTPSHDTFGEVFRVLDAGVFELAPSSKSNCLEVPNDATCINARPWPTGSR